MTDSVECRSDSQYPERPVALCHDGIRHTIETIIARWRTPQGKHFRVLTDGFRIYDIAYLEAEDQWEIQQG